MANNGRNKIVFEGAKLLGTLKKEPKPHIHKLVEILSQEYGKIIESGKEFKESSDKKWGGCSLPGEPSWEA